MKAACRVLFLLATISLPLADSQLQGAEWINPAGGEFDDELNWLGGVVPTTGIDALFMIPTSYTVNFTRDEQTSNLVIFGGDVLFDLDNHAYNLFGNIEISQSTLTLNEGTFNVLQPTSTLSILNGGKLTGNFTTVNLTGPGNPLIVGQGGTLGGKLIVNGGVLSQGTIAPGTTGAGTLFINSPQPITALLDTQSLLAIEIGGIIADTQHDVMQVAGGIQLGGQLAVPFINGYTPSMGHSVTFLQANSINGRFQSLSFPNLTGSIAAQVTYTSTTASIGFVNASPRIFNSGALITPPLPNYWNKASLWGLGQVPDSTNTVNMFSTQGTPQRVELNSQVEGAEAAFVHQITVGGSANTLTLYVPEDTNFTAVKQMTIGNMGVLELDDGTVHSNQVVISPGGVLQGTGYIDGDLVLGNNTGSNPAVLKPGFSPGTINVNGDFESGSNGMLLLEIDSPTSFDTLAVTQNADLDGTVRIDVSEANIAAIEPLSFSLLTAGDVDNEFYTVETVGTPDHFFAAEYTEVAAFFSLYEEGDMQRDDDLDMGDVMAFAVALKDPDGYEDEYGVSGDYSGDINDDGILDFDDIEPFANIHGIGLTAEEVFTIIANFEPVPEPTSTTLLGFVVSLASFYRLPTAFRR